MWHDSVCNTVQEPTVTSTIVAKKTTTWGESGFPSEFLGGLLESGAAGVVDVAFIGETMAGESINVAFTEALQPGRYALICYLQGSKDAEGAQLPAEGIVANLTVR